MAYKAAKGTRDFYPEEMQKRTEIFSSLKNVAKRYGFSEIESPAFESLDLLTAKSGDEVKEQIFVLEKRSKEEFGLRFDLTVPVTRMFIQKQKELPKPVKWFYCTRMWRYEAPQKGRLREFYQFGVELYGSDKASADAECLLLAIDLWSSLGITSDDVTIRINNRELLEGFIQSLGVGIDNAQDVEAVIRAIDKKEKISAEEFRSLLSFLSDEAFDSLQNFLEQSSVDAITPQNELMEKGKDNLMKVFSLLKESGKAEWITFSPTIARGLAYYTGLVFECFDKKGNFRALFGGGRYDNMIEQFGGSPCPAVGFAMGDVTLQLFLEEKGLIKEKKVVPDYVIAPVSEEYYGAGFALATKLRKKYTIEIDLMQRKLGKQFAAAEQLGADKVLIIGDEYQEGKVMCKTLSEKTEELLSLDDLYNTLDE